MIIKLIKCTTPAATREVFHVEQIQWRALKGVDGFVAQIGGVDRSDPDQVSILGLWRDADAYQTFMAGAHDEIFESGSQGGSYTDAETFLGERVLDMPGDSESLAGMIRSAGLVRLADCVVRPDRIDHFVRAQRDVWSPGMAAAPGMLGGIFMRGVDDQARFVVATFWASVGEHDRYVSDGLASLSEHARPERDLVSILGTNLLLEPTWSVLGSAGEA